MLTLLKRFNKINSMLCECCKKNIATQKHHRLPQTKLYKKLYPEYINHPDNIQMVCTHCHVSHRSPNLEIWKELRFCDHFKIVPRSKSCFDIYLRIMGGNEVWI
jgi:hypothetical protein